jgi:hypothetical protein
MSDIRHRIGIEAPQARVRGTLATTEGVASWWARDTRRDASEGGKLRLTISRGG